MATPVSTRTKTFTVTNGEGQTEVVTITVETYDPCPFTYSHTQLVCGHPGCRTS